MFYQFFCIPLTFHFLLLLTLVIGYKSLSNYRIS